jgi:hypothetical protein
MEPNIIFIGEKKMKNKMILSLLISVTAIIIFQNSVQSEKSEGDSVIGKKICREAPGPEDTTSFEIVLLKDGTIRGSGSYSGASAYFVLSSGTWKSTGSSIEIVLNYSGKRYGSDESKGGARTVKIKILRADLENSKTSCFEYNG